MTFRPNLVWRKFWPGTFWGSKPARAYKEPDWRSEHFEMRFVASRFEVRIEDGKEWFPASDVAGLSEAMRRATAFKWGETT